MDETNKLKDKIESEVIYKVFSANVPETVWKEQFEVVNEYCKRNFMNNRWSMIFNLVRADEENIKFTILFDRIGELENQIGELRTKLEQPKEVEEKKKSKTFGGDR